MTDACETNAAIAPAIQNAGSRQSTTCSRAYHFVSSSASLTAPSKRGVPTGQEVHRREHGGEKSEDLQLVAGLRD